MIGAFFQTRGSSIPSITGTVSTLKAFATLNRNELLLLSWPNKPFIQQIKKITMALVG